MPFDVKIPFQQLNLKIQSRNNLLIRSTCNGCWWNLSSEYDDFWNHEINAIQITNLISKWFGKCFRHTLLTGIWYSNRKINVWWKLIIFNQWIYQLIRWQVSYTLSNCKWFLSHRITIMPYSWIELNILRWSAW